MDIDVRFSESKRDFNLAFDVNFSESMRDFDPVFDSVQVVSTNNLIRIGTVTLLASEWVGEDQVYSQRVDIDGVTERSQVDLTPDVQQLRVFYEKDISFVTENEDGVVTVYAIGQKPTHDYTIQVTITEVGV